MSSLSSLRQQLRSKQDELKTYNKRLGELQKIQKSLINNFTDDIEDINDRITSLVDASEQGFDGFAHIEAIDVKIKGNKEKSIDMDSELSQTKSFLEKEIEAVQNKIESLKSEIAHLEQEIKEEEERQRRESEKKTKEQQKSNS